MHSPTWAIASLNYLTAMKLLLEQGLPLSAAALLRDAGIDTIVYRCCRMSKLSHI
ncbi:MAG: hypothetical protein RM049_06965 [Nostoc sp. DedQUE04]|uniref:hypothetical protein n=1 Tax=Nostoc sp. DedQUE04 TaxID=3075390 RepID=UPI002AD4D043|nr:hypothetical protein [Nostoc sp. DedQUE04]MDZ8135029.1 hypothetical protein [Nostoc sp. DedQUE04]